MTELTVMKLKGEVGRDEWRNVTKNPNRAEVRLLGEQVCSRPSIQLPSQK